MSLKQIIFSFIVALVAILGLLAHTAHAWYTVSSSSFATPTTSSANHRRNTWPSSTILEMTVPSSFITPFEMLKFLEDEFDNNFFSVNSIPSTRTSSYSSPMYQMMPMGMIERNSRYELIMDLPGVKKSDLKITVKDNVLTISAERKSTKQQQAQKQSCNNNGSCTEPSGEQQLQQKDHQSDATGAKQQSPDIKAQENSKDGETVAETKADIAPAELEVGKYWKAERRTGSMTRSFPLPEDVDINQITADLKDGQLYLTIGKQEEKVPKERLIALE
jgi:HSP20 family molecular chaperone IbpA